MKKRLLLTNKIRFLNQVLISSLVLNTIFIAIFFYFFIRENPIAVAFSYQPAPLFKERHFTNKEILTAFASLNFSKRAALLGDNRHIEEGIKGKDLALSLLVAKDELDIERALGRKIIPTRTLVISKDETLPLYAHISDSDINLIAKFINDETWPFTYKKLFHTLKVKHDDLTLVHYFLQSDEFLAVEQLFINAPIPIKKKLMVSQILEGKWETLHDFFEEQKKICDLSEKRRREFLLTYIKEGSKTAAMLLLYMDMPWALKYLDDKQVITVLNHLPAKSEKGSYFAANLLKSLRSDRVKEKAASYLSQNKEMAQKFINTQKSGEKPHREKGVLQHTVQPGESLWSIAKKYQIPVDELVKINQLTSTTLKTGKVIKLR